MTKRWSSTASGDGQTKRQASKTARKCTPDAEEVEAQFFECPGCGADLSEERPHKAGCDWVRR